MVPKIYTIGFKEKDTHALYAPNELDNGSTGIGLYHSGPRGRVKLDPSLILEFLIFGKDASKTIGAYTTYQIARNYSDFLDDYNGYLRLRSMGKEKETLEEKAVDLAKKHFDWKDGEFAEKPMPLDHFIL